MTPRTCQRWTAAEEAVIVEVYPTEGSAGVRAKLPHRSPAAIHMRAQALHVVVDLRLLARGRRGQYATKYLYANATTVMDVAWWICGFLAQTHRLPSAQLLMDRWGMSRSTAFRWRRIAREKLEAMRAREGQP